MRGEYVNAVLFDSKDQIYNHTIMKPRRQVYMFCRLWISLSIQLHQFNLPKRLATEESVPNLHTEQLHVQRHLKLWEPKVYAFIKTVLLA